MFDNSLLLTCCGRNRADDGQSLFSDRKEEDKEHNYFTELKPLLLLQESYDVAAHWVSTHIKCSELKPNVTGLEDPIIGYTDVIVSGASCEESANVMTRDSLIIPDITPESPSAIATINMSSLQEQTPESPSAIATINMSSLQEQTPLPLTKEDLLTILSKIPTNDNEGLTSIVTCFKSFVQSSYASKILDKINKTINKNTQEGMQEKLKGTIKLITTNSITIKTAMLFASSENKNNFNSLVTALGTAENAELFVEKLAKELHNFKSQSCRPRAQ